MVRVAINIPHTDSAYGQHDLSSILLSAIADLLLSGFVLILWRVQPGARHNLFWAIAFAALAFGELAASHFSNTRDYYAAFSCALMMSVFLAAMVHGTWVRIGYEQRATLSIMLGAASLSVIVVSGCIGTAGGNNATIILLAGSFLWSGLQLWRAPDMRLVAASFMLRSLMIGSFLLGRDVQEDAGLLFAVSVGVRLLLSSGLIYGLLSEVMGRARDSEQARLRAVELAAQRLSSILETLSDSLYVRDKQGHIVMANAACAKLLGLETPLSLIGRRLDSVLPICTAQYIEAENERVFGLRAARTLILETDMPGPDGNPVQVEQRLCRFQIDDSQEGVLVQMRDTTERKRYEELLVQRVTVDEVTQLPNRRLMMDRLRQALAMGHRGGGRCAVMMIDLDHFKRINETRGHTIGDALLASAARRLRETLREADTLARFGGDEFVVILTEPDPVNAPLRVEFAAQRVVEAFQLPFQFEELQVVTTASVGIAVWPTDGDDPDTLIRNADTAMYEVKHSSRNGFRLFNSEMNLRVQNILRIDAQLRGALEREELRVVFQPIVDAGTHRVLKVEALLRWQSGTLGNVPPDHFIPVAEETGQITAIGAWVLEESCRKLLALQLLRNDASPLVLSVNVSARQLRDSDFAETVREVLRKTGLPAEQLELELTERILIDDNAYVMGSINALRTLGVSLSLDDFGTGYSSLSYLTRIPLNTVKLDRSFVRDIETNPQSLQLATAVIAMCRSLGLALVAEGVESRDQAELLHHRGCRFLQGYHFGRPVKPEEIADVPGFQHGLTESQPLLRPASRPAA